MHPIKIIYNFLVSIQILALIVFLFYLTDTNFVFEYPIYIEFTLPLPDPFSDLVFNYYQVIIFDQTTIESMLIAMALLFLISSINVAGSGVSDSGSITLKQIIAFFSKYFLLALPILFLMGQSAILNGYATLVQILMFIIYALAFLIDIGSETNV